MARAVLITDDDALRDAVAELRAAPRIALDAEGNGMHAYRARLCTLQLCAARPDAPADTVFVLDALALPALTPLASLLAPGGPAAIIHDVAYDARLLASVGLALGRVVDTSLHARYLGLRETGLSALLRARAGVSLEKALQKDDWARRPLTAAQLSYLTDDVAYLGPLATALEHDAAAAGVAEEIAVETTYALGTAAVDAAAPAVPPYARIKGVRALPPAGRAILRELADLRERAAAAWDAPTGRVVSNQGLLTLARARPRTLPELRRAAGLDDRAATLGPELLAAITRGERAGDVPADERALFEHKPLSRAEAEARRGREAALAKWRLDESVARGVDPQVVLPGHALAELVKRGARTASELDAVPGFGAVRVRRYGEALIAVLASAGRPAVAP